jgi:hypothetical protein
LVSHTKGRTQIEGFENRVLRRIFGSKREEVAGGWRRLHTEELHKLYSSPNIIIRVIKSMKWSGDVSCIGEVINNTKFWLENLKEINNSEELSVDRKIILEWIFGKWDGKVWIGCIWLRTGTGGDIL